MSGQGRDQGHSRRDWGNNPGDFLKLLGNGKEFGVGHISYAYQEGEGGIADALALAAAHVGAGRVCVVLGDNIIEKNIKTAVDEYKRQERGARILLKQVDDPQRFGVPVLEGDSVIRIEEKPKNPASNYAVIGIYLYDFQVFDFIGTLSPSERGNSK